MRQRPEKAETDHGRGAVFPTADGWSDRGRVWIGRHSADQDVLVFDPSVSDPGAENLSFYSLSQFRTRAFPRQVAEQKIQEITDERGRAEAQARYEQRTALEAERASTQSAAREARTTRHREHAIDAHRRYVEQLAIEYQGVRDAAGREARGRRARCAVCGIAVDNFVGAACMACDDLLCSCGACGCGTRTRPRSRPKPLSKGKQ